MIPAPKPPSLVLAVDHEVDSIERVRSLLPKYQAALSAVGAHHLVLYASLHEAGRVLVTLGIRQPRSVAELLHSWGVREWFDDLGVEDIPAIFAGRLLEKLDVADPITETEETRVIVRAVTSVPDISRLVSNVHETATELVAAGIRKFWVYQAFDDPTEAMIVTEVDTEASAQRWTTNPGPSLSWLSRAGIGVYPKLFIGKVVHVMTFRTSL